MSISQALKSATSSFTDDLEKISENISSISQTHEFKDFKTIEYKKDWDGFFKINDKGFFEINEPEIFRDKNIYTRSGSFKFDENGYVSLNDFVPLKNYFLDNGTLKKEMMDSIYALSKIEGKNILSSSAIWNDLVALTINDLPAKADNLVSPQDTYDPRQNFHVQFLSKYNTQGLIENTGNKTDFAINGNGFFILKQPSAIPDQFYYTRKGDFQLNAEGYLVDEYGYYVMGAPIEKEGTPGLKLENLQPINFFKQHLYPKQTSEITLGAILDVTKRAPGSHIIKTDIYDSLGFKHSLSMEATIFLDNELGYCVFLEAKGLYDSDGNSSINSGKIKLYNNMLVYNEYGIFKKKPNVLLSFEDVVLKNKALIGGKKDTVKLNLDKETGGNLQIAGIGFHVSRNYQDGYPMGQFISVETTADGVILSNYSNGVKKEHYKMPLAIFKGEDSLVKFAKDFYRAKDLGYEVIVLAGEKQAGSVISNAVEKTYERSASFLKFNSKGHLLDFENTVLEGINLKTSEVEKVKLNQFVSKPEATTEIKVSLNLSAIDKCRFQFSSNIYDYFGQAYTLDFILDPIPSKDNMAGSWQVKNLFLTNKKTGESCDNISITIHNPILNFNQKGFLVKEPSTRLSFSDVRFGHYGDISLIWNDSSEQKFTTMFGSEPEVKELSANGQTKGYLENVQVTPNGEVMGLFSNGDKRYFYQLLPKTINRLTQKRVELMYKTSSKTMMEPSKTSVPLLQKN